METVRAKVLYNQAETSSVYRLGLAYDAEARGARPARFLTLRFDGPTPHIVPRPFSVSDAFVHDDYGPVTEVLYKPLGRVTSALTRVRASDNLHVLGLLGNGFPEPAAGHTPILCAGGIGNAPFALQVRHLLAGPFASAPSRVVLLLAGRSSSDIYIQPWVREAGITILETTDDGSRGARGRITDLIQTHWSNWTRPELYACGPAPMLHALQSFAIARGVRCHLSTEERMACGYGVCNACVVESRREGVPEGHGDYLKSCVEGPVFECREIYA